MPKKKKPELKPCPFCGCKAKYDSGFWDGTIIAQCGSARCPVVPQITSDSPEEAAAAWNTRKG